MKIPSLFLLAALTCLVPVQARPTAWSFPPGRFGLTIPSGWEEVPKSAVPVPTESKVILLLQPRGGRSVDKDAGCTFLMREDTVPQDVTQDEINSVLREWGQGRVLKDDAEADPRPRQVKAFSNERRNGVQVISMKSEAEQLGGGARAREWFSQFYLAMGGTTAALFRIACFAPAAGGGAAVVKIEGLMRSLTFKDR